MFRNVRYWYIKDVPSFQATRNAWSYSLVLYVDSMYNFIFSCHLKMESDAVMLMQ